MPSFKHLLPLWIDSRY